MINCPVCSEKLKISSMTCSGCGVHMSGEYHLPRLARLSPDHAKLAEHFVLCGGNLKKLGEDLGISHPTLRKRMDDMIAELEGLRKEDDVTIHAILDRIERGEIKAEQGLRLIKEVNGEL